MSVRFIDLFAGIGGIRLGVEQACQELGLAHRCVLSSEIDRKACETYKMNFGEDACMDVKDVKDTGNSNLLLAGFPCQSFSYAGKQEGFGDTRGTLFFEIERILRGLRPKAFLLENVRGLTTNDGGRTFKTVLKSLEDIGYGVECLLLNSSNFGVPQNRVRVYILGLLGKKPKLETTTDKGAPDSHKFKRMMDQTTLRGSKKHKVIKDILEGSVDRKYFCSDGFVRKLRGVVGDDFGKLHGKRLIDYRDGNSIHSWDLGIKGGCTPDEKEFMNALIRNRRKKKFGPMQDGKMLSLGQIKTFYDKPGIEGTVKSLLKKGYLKEVNGRYNPVAGNMSFEVFKFLDPESVSITLVASDAHKLGVVANNEPRRITPREAARIQGFPDSFRLHQKDSVAYKQLGNSVSVPVIREIMVDFLKNNGVA